MSSRPVPRRESPWGLPEGDTRQPVAHRCNDRAEDVIQALFEGNPFKTVPGPFKLFWQCMRSKPGYIVHLSDCSYLYFALLLDQFGLLSFHLFWLPGSNDTNSPYFILVSNILFLLPTYLLFCMICFFVFRQQRASSSDDPRLHFEVHRAHRQRMIEHRA
ncbi:hypothetical protein MUK42_16199 [Musa troglodytarum]|uniref:Uncharacterized protein n=1 Tax=Musa troglodytarum TaxID=320322 RepID=A0A9E7HVJ0_9LILI|nr:hypothetical protein MUK42_16199 [Musa troglodytarum]